MPGTRLVIGLAAALLGLASGCGGEDDGGTESAAPAFSAAVDHPLVPLSSVGLTVIEGTERDPGTGETVELRVESRVLDEPEVVAGVPVAVVDVKEYEDGDLVEHTLDYYAQRGDGSVWYFGEKVDDYEAGKLVGHTGQWLAGEDGAKAGLFMPADPAVGQKFEQEQAPGVAEDLSEVVAVGLEVRTPAGTFSDCVRTKDFAPLDNATEHKLYCPGVGLVREEAPGVRVELVRYD